MAFLVFLACSFTSRAAQWNDIPPEDLAATTPTVDPEASVEILFKEMVFDNSNIELGSLQSLYVRLKIFTEKGVDELRTIPLRYSGDNRVTDLAARVVKPDGSTVELNREDFFDTEIERTRSKRTYRKAFAPPGLAVGDIVEFQATLDSHLVYGGLFVEFQDRWPARRMNILIKPINYPGFGSRAMTFRFDKEDGGVNSRGFFTYHLKNIPAERKEPFQPPAAVISPWMLFLQFRHGESADRFWHRFAGELHKASNKLIRPRAPVIDKAAKLTANARTPEEKLRVLYDYSRVDIINSRHNSGDDLSPDQRKAIKSDDRADEILVRGYGSPQNLRVLFASLATAAGFDARLARASDRTRFYFDKKLHTERAISDTLVAVQLGEEWRFFDPGSPYHEFGTLRWRNEGVAAIVADPRKPIFAVTASSGADSSLEKRTARLSLADDGTLSGSVALEYRGHRGVEMKEELDGASPAEREKIVREQLRDRIPNAEISDLNISRADARDRPLQISMTVTVPAYAERLGDRLFVQPGVFERGSKPLLQPTERVHDIVFDHSWTEEDDIEITLPADYRLDEASAPHPFDKSPFAKYDVKLAVQGREAESAKLQYTRRFTCRGVPVKVKFYTAIKEIFDEMHRQDQHTLALKRTAGKE